MDRSETTIILLTSVCLGIYGGWGETVGTHVLLWLGAPLMEIHALWQIIDLLLVTLGCLLLIWLYKRLRVGFYPSTFLYCFILPEKSNPDGKSKVVGYCHITPDMDNGEIIVQGTSYFWQSSHVDLDSAVTFRSTYVRGIKNKESGETTCYIRYDLDTPKRFYRHAVLEFRLVPPLSLHQKVDTYAGYLRSTNSDLELQDVQVRGKGYAERYQKGLVPEDEIRAILGKRAFSLQASLEAMLNGPIPTLWKERKDVHVSELTNCWGHKIQTPQCVILNPLLRPFIEKYISRVLTLYGVDDSAIENFKRLAIEKAKINEDQSFTLVAYERELKAGLIGVLMHSKEDQALSRRANVIYDEIKSRLVGKSLLDIGCGNGLVSHLARHEFDEVLLLDVVRYVPAALNLPFKEYKDGEPLPVDKTFDTVLLLTVLHHSANPLELLKAAWGATNKRLIIIESVVGVHRAEPLARYELLNESDEDQIGYAAFIDWFYNRVLHNDVPVPYNFTNPENWQARFVANNMRLVEAVHLGQDLEISPEYHILFVLEK